MSDQFNPQAPMQPQYPAQPQYAVPPQYAQPYPPQPGYQAQPMPQYAQPQQYAPAPYGYAPAPYGYAPAPAPAPVPAPAPEAEPEVIIQEIGFADYGFGEEDSGFSGHNFGNFMDDDNSEPAEEDTFNAFNSQTPNFDIAAVEAASKADDNDKAMFQSTTPNFDLTAVEAASKSSDDKEIFSNSRAVGEMDQTASEVPSFDAALSSLAPQAQTFDPAALEVAAEPVAEAPAPAPVFEVPAPTPVAEAPAPAPVAEAPAAPSVNFMAAMQGMLGAMSATTPKAPEIVEEQKLEQPESKEAAVAEDAFPFETVAPSEPDIVISDAPAQTIQDISNTSTKDEEKGSDYWAYMNNLLKNFDDGQVHADITSGEHAKAAGVSVIEAVPEEEPTFTSAIDEPEAETEPEPTPVFAAPAVAAPTFADLVTTVPQPKAEIKAEPVVQVKEEAKVEIESVPEEEPSVIEEEEVKKIKLPFSKGAQTENKIQPAAPKVIDKNEGAREVKPKLDKKAKLEAERAERRAQREAEKAAKAAKKAELDEKEEGPKKVFSEVIKERAPKKEKKIKEALAPEDNYEVPEGFKGILFKVFPNKYDRPIEIARKIIAVISIIAIVVCGIYFLVSGIGSGKQNKNAKNWQNTYTEGEEGTLTWEDIYRKYPEVRFPTGMDIKFAELYATNQDLVGWISIPGLKIDYPVCQTTDDEYYLKYDFNKKKSKYGCIFVSAANNVRELDQNTVVYGHCCIAKGKAMFASLRDYADPDVFIKNPIIEFNTLYGDYKFKVWRVFVTNGAADGDNGYLFRYTYTFPSPFDINNYAGFIWQINRRALYDTGVDLDETDQILTLSTCTYEFKNARFVVVARLLRDGESEEVDSSSVKVNENPKYPQAWYDKKGKTNPYAKDELWQPV